MIKRKNLIWQIIQTVCWFIFAGYCVQTGALTFNYIYSLFNPIVANNIHLGLNLSNLYDVNKSIYSISLFIIILLSALKAFVFFVVLKLFKVFDLDKPFDELVLSIITRITLYSFIIGVISVVAKELTNGMENRGYKFDGIDRYWHDGVTFLMFSSILFVITLVL